MAADGVLFVPYRDTLDLLGIDDAMRVCEEVYRMHARGTVQWSDPPAFKLDVGEPWHNHWHVKAVFLKDIPATGMRMYNYYDDGVLNTVGRLSCARYIVLTDPASGAALAIVEEHWAYAIRSTAAAVLAMKWLGPKDPRVLGLVGVGTMGLNALQCLRTLYDFEEIVCTSRRPETRADFAATWSAELGIPVRAVDTIEEVVRSADIGVGGTTSTDIVARAEWVKRGATYISLARREMDPAGWAKFDKVVIDSWDVNIITTEFSAMIESGQFSRDMLHGEIGDVVAGTAAGREADDERILLHTTGIVSQDIAIAHFIYQRAKAEGRGIRLPPTAG